MALVSDILCPDTKYKNSEFVITPLLGITQFQLIYAEILPPEGLNFQVLILASKQLKMTFINFTPLVVEFQTFKFWTLLIKCIASSGHLKLLKCEF